VALREIRIATVPRLSPWLLPVVVLLACAAAVAASLGLGDESQTNLMLFAAWSAAVALVFALALRLPLRIAGKRYRAALWNALLAGIAVIVAFLANVAVFRHDVHLDLSREAGNTPPPQLAAAVEGLKTDISLTYLYNNADENALKATELLTIAGRQNRHLHVRTADLDKEPAMARRLGVRSYNTAVIEAEDRRVVVENTVDVAQMAYAVLRVLKKRVDVICFVTGHGEGFSDTSAHVHYSHVETLKGHNSPGSGDVLTGEPDGLDRLQLAVTTLGYAVRAIVPATMTAVPPDCALVADIGPRRAYAPGEATLLSAYLAGGGRLLLAVGPEYPIAPELAGLLGRLGLASDQAVVIDPLNHYASDDDKVAVPYYPPHPITSRVALTIFADARPITVTHPPASIATSVLVSSSNDSYLRPLPTDAQETPPTPEAGTRSAPRGPAILAVALEGRWPEDAASLDRPFRLVLVGNSNFVSNSYFPYVSNGDLAVGIVRWLAGDEAIPAVKPQRLSLEQIDLTARQMRDIFVIVELMLPLSVALLGGIVWWRRR
jgi:ABC-2 type transport system permease protein